MLEGINKNGAGKVKIHGVVVEEAIHPLMNTPAVAAIRNMKNKLRASLFEAWEYGVSDCRYQVHVTKL
jgi:hypothetical protein